MEEIFAKMVEQNKRIIEQNRKLQEQLDNMNCRMQALEKKVEFANAVSVVNNRSISILTSAGNLFNEEEQEDALNTVKNMREEEEVSLVNLIDLSRTKYI